MNDILTFAVALGALLCGFVVVAAWLFRTSSAHIAVKLILPSALLALSIYAPFTFIQFLGRPYPTTFDRMPEQIELIAFKSIDDDKSVDLFVAEKESTRLYEIPLDKQTKQALRKAQGDISQGRPVILSKTKNRATDGLKGSTHGVTDIMGNDRPGYVLYDSVQPDLPPKE